MFCKDQITGTLVNYYITCKREVWLYGHNIHANQEDENMLMGKALADIKENGLQDFAFSNLKFDKLSKQRGHYLITEYKKLISGKTVIVIEDNAENFTKIETILNDIVALVNEPKPPKFSPQKICESCAYRDYCI